MIYRMDITYDVANDQTWLVVREDNAIIYKNYCEVDDYSFAMQLDRVFRTCGKPEGIQTAAGNIWEQKAVKDVLAQWEVKVEYA